MICCNLKLKQVSLLVFFIVKELLKKNSVMPHGDCIWPADQTFLCRSVESVISVHATLKILL